MLVVLQFSMANLLAKLVKLQQQNLQAKDTVAETERALRSELLQVQSQLRNYGQTTGDPIRDWAVLQFGLGYEKKEAAARKVGDYLKRKQGELVGLFTEEAFSGSIRRTVKVSHLLKNPLDAIFGSEDGKHLVLSKDKEEMIYSCDRPLEWGKLKEYDHSTFYQDPIKLDKLLSGSLLFTDFAVLGRYRSSEYECDTTIELRTGEYVLPLLKSFIWGWGSADEIVIPPLYQRWEEKYGK